MSKQLNFAQQMDEVLKTLGPQQAEAAAPCLLRALFSSAVLEQLCRYFEITVLCSNPNTWPAEIFCRRGEELKDRWRRRTRWGSRSSRTTTTRRSSTRLCRGWKTSRSGAGGAPSATVCGCAGRHSTQRSTALIGSPPRSPSAPTRMLPASIKSGRSLIPEFGIRHLPSDFKKQNGYLRSLQLSEEYGLYRQDYCGCRTPAQRRGDEPLSRLLLASPARRGLLLPHSGHQNCKDDQAPTQGTMLVAIPTARPALLSYLADDPGHRIAPLDATGSMMPMLVTVVTLPALATAVGFIPAMEKAKANSSRMAGSWLWVCIMAK